VEWEIAFKIWADAKKIVWSNATSLPLPCHASLLPIPHREALIPPPPRSSVAPSAFVRCLASDNPSALGSPIFVAASVPTVVWSVACLADCRALEAIRDVRSMRGCMLTNDGLALASSYQPAHELFLFWFGRWTPHKPPFRCGAGWSDGLARLRARCTQIYLLYMWTI
jgi:hypothetical protein